jgi:hypothetical protein
MLYLLSGAAASGKKTVAPVVTQRVANLVAHHEQEIYASTGGERMRNMEVWLERAMEYEARGNDLLLLAQSPLGEVLASPNADQLTAIAPCLLDCHDHERARRLALRTPDPRWPFCMDTLCWAAFHRMHAVDPQFEQRVLLSGEGRSHYHWDRWTSWRRGDPRWEIELIDTTHQELSGTVDALASWIERVRSRGAALARAAAWWQ